MKAIKNKAFARGGHECELVNLRDELPMYKSGGNICQQIQNSFLRSIMAAEANAYSLKYLKSQRNIEKERLRHLLHKHMIHPFSDTRQRWEALMVLIFGSAFFVIPLDCAFFNFPLVRSISQMGFWKVWRSFLDLVMLIDVAMNFFTGYWDPTKQKVYKIGFVKYRLMAALFYYVLYFHVLTCFTIVLIGVQTKHKTKLPNAPPDAPLYEWVEDDDTNGFYGTYLKVFRAVIYLGTFCFSAPSIANYVPKLMYTAIWIASKFIMLFLTGELMECVISTRSSPRKYVEMVRELQEYMRYKQLPVHLQNRLLHYYEFKYQKSYFKETEILNVVSGQLKQELLMHSCRKLVEHVGFFQNLPLPLLLRLVSALITEVYMVNDVIIKAGTSGACMYFIVSGCVAIYTRTGFEFEKIGHKCQIPQVPDDLPMFDKQGSSIWRRIYNYIVRLSMASGAHAGGWKYLVSHAAIMREHKKHLKNLYVIHPFSKFRIYWETFMLVIFGLQFIVIPLELAIYYTEIRNQVKLAWYMIRIFLDIICLVDVALNFLTGYLKTSTKEVILEPYKIMKNYSKSLFFPDLISSVMGYTESMQYIFKIHHVVIHVLKCFALLKLFRMFTFLRYCRNLADQLHITYACYNITMVIICYTLFVHIVACTSIFVDTHSKKFNVVELYDWRFSEPQTDFFQNYCLNLLRALIMINNIYFGLDPMNVVAQIYMLVIWAVSRVINIVIIGHIMKIVVTRRSANIKYVENIRQLQEYMRHKKLPEYLQKRILCYYEFRYQKNFFRESDILNSITGTIRQEVIMHSCRKLVENVDFLNQLPTYLLIKIVSYLKYEVFMLNDVIFRYHTPGYCMYFILTGSVAIYTPQGQEVIHLKDGAYFGEIALLIPNIARTTSVVSVEISELYRLDRRDFNKVIAPHPPLVKMIQSIAEKRLEETIFTMKRERGH